MSRLRGTHTSVYAAVWNTSCVAGVSVAGVSVAGVSVAGVSVSVFSIAFILNGTFLFLPAPHRCQLPWSLRNLNLNDALNFPTIEFLGKRISLLTKEDHYYAQHKGAGNAFIYKR